MKRPLSILALCLAALCAARGQTASHTPRPETLLAKLKVAHFDPRKTEAQAEALAAAVPEFARVHTDNGFPQSWLLPPTDPYRVGPGDQLELELMEFPETLQTCLVLPDGTLLFHTCPAIKVEGMTVLEVKAAIEQALSVDYRSPQVSIIVREADSRHIWILGRCKEPGVYTLDGPTTILEAIGRAGGFEVARSLGDSEELVDLQHSFLVRNGRLVPIDFERLIRDGDTSENIYLQNDDYIYLPSGSGERAYVLGAVGQPRIVDFREHMTLTEAISNAGGFAHGSYPEHVMLIRNSLVNPEVAVVNVNAIIRGKATDVALEPRDIIWVPNAPWQRLENYVGDILTTFARTVAANEGARAASPQAQPVGLDLGISTGSSGGGGSSGGSSSGAASGSGQNSDSQ